MSEKGDYTQRVIRKMGTMAKEDLPAGWCFMVVIYQPVGEGDMHFTTNGTPDDVVVALRTLADQIEAQRSQTKPTAMQ